MIIKALHNLTTSHYSTVYFYVKRNRIPDAMFNDFVFVVTYEQTLNPFPVHWV